MIGFPEKGDTLLLNCNPPYVSNEVALVVRTDGTLFKLLRRGKMQSGWTQSNSWAHRQAELVE
jgi:hypothetical protein